MAAVSLAREAGRERLAAEHENLCAALDEAGAEVVVAEPTTLDAIYTYDPALVGDEGVVLLRPGKTERLEEVAAMAAALERADVPVTHELEEPLLAEGGDFFWLDSRTLCAGRGYRTNRTGSGRSSSCSGCGCSSSTCRTTTGPRRASICSR